MNFHIHTSYNLDLLNFINILTGEKFYTDHHEGMFERFGKNLSSESKDKVKQAVQINNSAMLGPILSLVISAVPNFEKRSVIKMFEDPAGLERYLMQYPYYDERLWAERENLFQTLIPVIQELEKNDFRKYWQEEKLPAIKKKQHQLHKYANQFHLDVEIEGMLGNGQAPESITVYLCSFAAPHGIKICGPKYISDIAFSMETTLGIAVHEMFHPPYSARNLQTELERLGNDPLLQHSFNSKDPKYGYPSMTGFIEENVVEAMAIFICHKIGLEEDPLEYFEKHDEGSHRLSVVLFDAFSKHPKSIEQPFEDYFRELLEKLPVGSLDREYEAIMSKK